MFRTRLDHLYPQSQSRVCILLSPADQQAEPLARQPCPSQHGGQLPPSHPSCEILTCFVTDMVPANGSSSFSKTNGECVIASICTTDSERMMSGKILRCHSSDSDSSGSSIRIIFL